jgi:hypothetical protein
MSRVCVAIIALVTANLTAPSGIAQAVESAEQREWLTVPANLDMGYRKTQFFTPNYNTAVGDWDSRISLWLPPGKGKFSWGPYIRIAGIAGSQSDAWQNEWIAEPGLGLQLFPFSSAPFKKPDSIVGKVFGPLRAFGEYNFVDYWGALNTWRPRNQVLAGFDYWKAVNVNILVRPLWAEIWNGAYWQSSNEFTDRYDSVKVADSIRLGVRVPGRSALSTISPYLFAQSSRTKYDYAGQTTDFYWENSLLGGGGIRVAPSISNSQSAGAKGMTRLVFFGEYEDTAMYYGPKAPPSVPRYDILGGISISFADWYK